MIRIKIEGLKENAFILIPMVCILIQALYELIANNFLPVASDFADRYKAGQLILSDPSNLYKNVRFYYLPSFATLLSITISVLPYVIAYFSYFVVNTILAMIMTLEYNKILLLLDVKDKTCRFLFLLVTSIGYAVMYNIYNNDFKSVFGVLLFLVLRRELQYRKEEKVKDYKFYFINYNLLIFGIGIIPPLIFLAFIYVFFDIHIRDFFKMINIKKYCIALSVFLIQNFIIFLYPNLFFDFLNSYERNNITQRGTKVPFFYTEQWFDVENNQPIFLFSAIFLASITIILILLYDMKIEKKFAIFSLASLFFSAWAWKSIQVLPPFALLIIVPFLNQYEKGLKFVRTNLSILIALCSIVVIYFLFPNFTVFKYFPSFKEWPFIIFVNLRGIIALCLYFCCTLYLYLRNLKSINGQIKFNTN